jgi:hypothetical protein
MTASCLRALFVLTAALLIGLLEGPIHAQAPREIVIGVIYPMMSRDWPSSASTRLSRSGWRPTSSTGGLS